MLESPTSDQEWDFSTVLRNLGRHRTSNNKLEKILEILGSFLNGVLSSVDDLVQQAKYHSGNKAALRDKYDLSNASAKMHRVTKEWNSLEHEFVKNLLRQAELAGESATKFVQRLENLEGFDIVPLRKAHERRIHQLEHDIVQLEHQLDRKRLELGRLEAVDAPFDALKCQATCHLADFRIDEYTGDGLQISFEHAVEGVETRVTFDLNCDLVSFSSIAGAPVSPRADIPAIHPVAKFHDYLLKAMIHAFSEKFQATKEPLVLQEAISKFSFHLGRLDVSAREMMMLSQRFQVTLTTLPTIRINLKDGMLLQIDYDTAKSPIGCFLPVSLVVSRGDQNEALDMSAKYTANGGLLRLCNELYHS